MRKNLVALVGSLLLKWLISPKQRSRVFTLNRNQNLQRFVYALQPVLARIDRGRRRDRA